MQVIGNQEDTGHHANFRNLSICLTEETAFAGTVCRCDVANNLKYFGLDITADNLHTVS